MDKIKNGSAAPDAQHKPTPAASESPADFKRFYKGEVELDSDLFRLELALMKKNISIDQAKPEYAAVEHVHFFRTYDSAGRKMESCSPVGGHFHRVSAKLENGEMKVVVSQALKRVAKMVNDTQVIQEVELPEDNHSHEVAYMRSDKIKQRQASEEAAKFITKIQMQQSPRLPAGAKEGA